jgi:iron complex outermembrane receptor protein
MMARLSLLSAISLLALRAAPAVAQETEVEQVIVTAAPYAVSLDSMTTSVNVVSREQLDTAPAAGLGDILNGLPGLRSTAFGPGASRPIVRGFSGPRVLVLQNGVGMVDASTLSPDHAVASDPGEATRIEVLRGPSTLAYGGSGIGGVVNMLDERVPQTTPLHGFEGHAAASASSVDDGYSFNGGFKAGSGPLVFAADMVHRRSGDYDIPVPGVSRILAESEGLTVDPGRRQRNTSVEMDAYGVGASWVHEDGFLGASVKRTDTTYGVPYPQILAPIDPEAEGPVEIHLQQTRYDLRGEQAVSWGLFEKVNLSAGYADYEHAEIEVEDGAVGTVFLSDGAEGRLELVQRERDGWKGAVGVQALSRRLEAIGDEAFIPSTDITEAGVFTLQRLERENWGLDGGLRLDRRTLETDTMSRDFTNWSASLGGYYRPSEEIFLALAVSRNARAPTESELFADGPHAGTDAFEIGGPSLESETVLSAEATARWTGPLLRVEGHLWAARYTGYIEQSPTGDEEDGLPVFQYFATDADFVGSEIEGSYEAWGQGERSLMIEAAYDWVRADTEVGPAARTPPWSLTGRLVWKQPRFDGELEVRRVGAQDRVAAFELRTEAYTLVNLKAAYRPFEDHDLRFFAEGRNLTDEEAREHASFLKDIAPQPGRNFRAGVAVSF